MRTVIECLEGTDLAINVPTQDNSLASCTGLMIKWINPLGVQGEVSGEVASITYVRGLVGYASVIAGDWTFWAEGVTAAGNRRGTFAVRVTVIKKGRAR